ncbi:hypothetical protein ABW19_dt0208384 [Dactylella cylindrospora]|nr:hypothetical protein ABW19_dt0208384 [Dactylella cylindrospora]
MSNSQRSPGSAMRSAPPTPGSLGSVLAFPYKIPGAYQNSRPGTGISTGIDVGYGSRPGSVGGINLLIARPNQLAQPGMAGPRDRPDSRHQKPYDNPMWDRAHDSKDPNLIFFSLSMPVLRHTIGLRKSNAADSTFEDWIITRKRQIQGANSNESTKYRDEMLMLKMATQLWGLGPGSPAAEWQKIIDQWKAHYGMIYDDQWGVRPTFVPQKGEMNEQSTKAGTSVSDGSTISLVSTRRQKPKCNNDEEEGGVKLTSSGHYDENERQPRIA